MPEGSKVVLENLEAQFLVWPRARFRCTKCVMLEKIVIENMDSNRTLCSYCVKCCVKGTTAQKGFWWTVKQAKSYHNGGACY